MSAALRGSKLPEILTIFPSKMANFRMIKKDNETLLSNKLQQNNANKTSASNDDQSSTMKIWKILRRRAEQSADNRYTEYLAQRSRILHRLQELDEAQQRQREEQQGSANLSISVTRIIPTTNAQNIEDQATGSADSDSPTTVGLYDSENSR